MYVLHYNVIFQWTVVFSCFSTPHIHLMSDLFLMLEKSSRLPHQSFVSIIVHPSFNLSFLPVLHLLSFPGFSSFHSYIPGVTAWGCTLIFILYSFLPLLCFVLFVHYPLFPSSLFIPSLVFPSLHRS